MNTFSVRLRSEYSGMNRTEKKIADYLLLHSRNIFHLPISQLANEAEVSQAAWVRFAQKLTVHVIFILFFQTILRHLHY